MTINNDEIHNDLIRVCDDRIIEILEGSMIAPHPGVDQNHYSFAEYFYPLGIWKSVRSARATYWISGEWSVESNKLIVKRNDVIFDREVWVESGTGNLAIMDMSSGFDDVLIMKISSII